MGEKKYQEEIETLFKKSHVVDFSSIERIVHAKNKNTKNYTKLLARNLVQQKRIHRITKGYYTIHDDPALLVFCLKPAYLGLQDALSIYNLWKQETIPIIITTMNARQGIRNVFGTNVLVRSIEKKYFFGIEYIQQGDFYFPYSDIEKTFLDLVYFKQDIRADVLKEIKKKMKTEKLKEYLSYYPREFQEMVKGKLSKV